MSARRWLLALCLFGILLEVYAVTNGYLFFGAPIGVRYAFPTTSAFVYRVTYVVPGGTAAKSGLRPGDVIDSRLFAPGMRYRFFNGGVSGQLVHLPVTRGRQNLTITYMPRRWYMPWHAWFFVIGTLWALLFAALLAWRRPENPEARVLCVLLVLVFESQMIANGNLELPSVGLEFALNIFGQVLSNVGLPLLAVYALLFARPPGTLRRVLATLSYFVASLALVWGVVSCVADWNGFIDPAGPLFYGPLTVTLNTAELLLPLLCALATIPALRGAERTRFTWTLSTIGFFYASLAATSVLVVIPGVAYGLTIVQIQTVCTLVAPLGMTYALLNRRLLDIGFALNRATTFAGVSVVLVGIFVLVEWALSDWMQSTSHSANLAVTGALALVLGFSIRFVQGRVEHVVDNVFFRKRRQDEEAIRRMAAEAPYITERHVLLARTEAVLSKHADAAFAGILLDDSSGTYGSIGENDPALVALRARHERLDLHTLQTSIEGDYAYPMVARGRLIGALVLGPKRSGETYAPDESQAIGQLAHSVAGAIDVLATARGIEPIAGNAMEEVRLATRTLLAGMNELQQRLDDALRARAAN